MPSRRSRSGAGEVSPAISTTPNGKRKSVSPPEEASKPPKKLKLTVRKQEEAETEPDLTPGRPKRKSTRPARYSDQAEQHDVSSKPVIVQEDSATMIEGNLSAQPADANDNEDDESKPAGYGMDFLMSYIEDSPTSPAPASATKVDSSTESEKRVSIARETSIPTISRSRPATPQIPPSPYEPIPNTNLRAITPAPTPPALAALPKAIASLSPDRPPINDEPHIMVKKLQSAIHALSGLNVPSPPRALIADVPIAHQEPQKNGTQMTHSLEGGIY